MKARWILPLLLPAITTCFLAPEVEVAVRSNGVWSADSTAVLLVESRYLTRRPTEPYWRTDVGHTGWETVVYLCEGGDFADPVELARWPDELGESSGGWMQSQPLAWHRDPDGPGTLYYLSAGVALARDLSDTTVVSLLLPEAAATQFYGLPSAEVPAVRVLPSPDGLTVAVMYEIVTEDPDVQYGMLFYDALAYFDRAGEYLGALALGDTFDLEQLWLEAPEVDPPLGNPEPPGFQLYAATRSLTPGMFLWARDSGGVYLVHGPMESPRALHVPVGLTGDITDYDVSTAPAVPLPAPGGPVSAAGELLAFELDPDDPNAARPFLHELTGWVDFYAAGDAALADLDYTY